MKKLFISFSLLCIVYYANSQGSQPYKYLGNYAQPAPNAAALGKYVDYPVSYYTGAPTISIPLYDLKDGGVGASVSLSYHPSGIRVSEMASWVGLGWALSAGGMITRSVRGGPDEGVANPQHVPVGYYVDSGIRKMPLLPHPVSGAFPGIDPLYTDRELFLNSVNGGFSDTEPDLFSFNFGGYGGKFVFDENRTPRLLCEQDIKIEVNFTSGFNYWIITTPDGVKYFFGENSMYEVNSVFTSGGGQDYNTLKPSSWVLTRIVNPNTKDTIYYNYTAETYSYFDLGSESNTFSGPPGENSVRAACTQTNYPITSALKTTVSGLRLVNIISKNYKIVFGVNTSSARQDLVSSASNYPYKLDSIKIYNSQNQCLKQYVLAYNYFTSSTTNNLSTPVLGFLAGDVSDSKRLKLLSVIEYSGDGSFNKPSYNFFYEETYQLPRRLSYDQDHWGYSNNYSGNSNNRLTPLVYHPVCSFTPTGGGANRNPKWPDMQSCAIKSIRDPLGAITNFEFEAHTSTVAGPYSTVGGLRIKKITNIDSVTGVSKVRSFTYGNGGILYKTPQYLFFTENEYYFPLGIFTSGGASYRGYSINFGRDLICAIRQSQSIVPLQDFQGNHIGYPIVKETFGTNGEGGYKTYSFMADQLVQNNSRLDMSNYTSYQTVSVAMYGSTAGIYGNGHFNDISPQNLIYYSGYNVDGFYPAAPLQVDFRHGQQLSEDTYDSAGTIISSVKNIYKQIYNENYWMRGFKISRSNGTTAGQDATARTDDALTYYKLHTGRSQLISTSSIDYKDGKKFVSTVRYGYESAYHTSKTSDTAVNSIGDSIITKTYYSFDYTNGATGDNIFGKLKARNMLLPVAQRVWKNNQLISGSVTLYKDFAASAPDTFINASKIYSLEISAPLTTGQAGEGIALTGQFSTLLPNAYFKEKANFSVNGTTGKIIEQNLINDKTQALIWDNTYSLPLAQVDNALFTDIAYSSFETNEKGNWTYVSGSVASDATAPTGGKAYSLSGGLSKTGFVIGKAYLLSYWLKSGASISISGGTQTNSITGRTVNGWTYKQVTVTASTTTLTLSGSGSIDELRLHPNNAQMTTYTYDSQLRMIAQCSPNGTVSYYAYDSMNRLTDIKDQFGNIVKAFEYNYGRLSRAGQ